MSRFVFPIVALLAVLVLLPEAAYACEHCFGGAGDNETTRGIEMAMTVLIAITGVVFTGIVSFFRRMSRRAALLESGPFEVNASGELVQNDEL